MKPFKLLALFLFLTLNVSAEFGMPSMREMVTHFFTNYSYDDQEGYLRFQRKKQGWYVSLERYDNMGHYSNDALLWSKERNNFLDIDYPKANDDTTGRHAAIEKFFRRIEWDFTEYGFERALYYGYPGWDWDIINEPIDAATASDTLLESMGRGYSSYASGFVTDQFGDHFINNDSDRVLLKATDSISKSRLNKLISYDLKSIEYYTKLKKRNPQYLTKVGNIAIKTANEYMFLSYWLTLAGDSLRAREYVQKAAYPDSMLVLSRRYLQSLPKNSILITGGDNDTYPVWYVQVIEHFRSDVTVLNYNLLALRRQLLWLDNRYHSRLFTTKDSLYLKKEFDYSLYSNKSKKDSAVALQVFLNELRDNNNPFFDENSYYGMEGIRTYYAKKIFLGSPGTVDKAVDLHDYLLLNDYMLLDIIQTNPPGTLYGTFNIDLLAPLLQFNGTVYELVE
jgi:hypothetical protein